MRSLEATRRSHYTVRLIGIDTPEVYGGLECGGRQASDYMKRLAPTGRRVRLRTDPTQDTFDRYDRLLAYVKLRGGPDAALAQLRAGWADVYVYGGNPFQRVGAFRARAALGQPRRPRHLGAVSMSAARFLPPQSRSAPGSPMAVSTHDEATAGELAEQVAASTGSRRTWRKVTTLLELFGVYRLTESVRERIAAALDEAGIVAEPPLTEVERYGTVRLALRETPHTQPPRSVARNGEPFQATVWRPGMAPSMVDDTAPYGGIIWIDVDITRVTSPSELHAAISPLCGPELTLELVDKLLDADPLPKVEDYDGVRNVTAFSVTTREGDEDPSDPDASKAGSLDFQLVEFLAAERWIVSCWHKRRPTSDGAHEEAELDPEDHSKLVEHVKQRWQESDHSRQPETWACFSFMSFHAATPMPAGSFRRGTSSGSSTSTTTATAPRGKRFASCVDT